MTPSQKAIAVCAFFAGTGLISYLFYPGQGLPALGIFFATLVVNTYYSIKFFSQLFPRLRYEDSCVDVALVALYAGLAWALSSVFLFEVIGLAIFLVAIGKYALLREQGAHGAVLQRKMQINSLGVALFASCLLITLAGFEAISAWALAALFFAANVYLLLLNPMYRTVTE